MKGLLELDRSQDSLLDRLRDPNSDHAEMLTALLVTSCQFELSKLIAARLDLGSFAEAAVGVLCQFATADRCALFLEPDDLPPVHALIGDWPEIELDGVHGRTCNGEQATYVGLVGAAINVNDGDIGRLSAVGLPEPLRRADLVGKAAEQISTGIELLLEAERLRRAAAAAQALDIVTSLDSTYGDQQLESLAGALGGLANAIGAKLFFENPRLSGPVACAKGKLDGNEDCRSSFEMIVDGRLPLKVLIQWATSRSDADVARAREIVESLASALERIEQNARLQMEVETDPLTGVGNRRMGSRMLARALNRATRAGEPLVVLLLDLDKFKSVNDTLGHDAGDAVLVSFSKALAATVRNYDVVARWGGEEFLVIAPDTDIAGAQALANRILLATPEYCAAALPPDRRQTVSIGIAVFPESADFPDGLVRAADKAMYQAKAAGRNQYALGTPADAG